MTRALLVVVLCGCNQIFGLGPTRPAPEDAAPDADLCAILPSDPLFHDEDSDSLEDACDNCPGLANRDQADTLETANGGSADMIGDACDPSPTIGGDRLAAFMPFAAGGELASWNVVAGSWKVASDALVYTDATAIGTGTVTYTGATLHAPYAVEARVVIDALPAPGATGTVAIAVADSGFGCELDFAPGGDIVYVYTSSGTDQTSLATPIAAGSAYQLRLVWTASELRCRFDDADGQHVAMHAGDPSTATAALKLRFDHFAGHFDYVAIYDLSGEP